MSIENFEVYYKNVYNEYITYNHYDSTYKTLDRLPKNINNYYITYNNIDGHSNGLMRTSNLLTISIAY